MKTTRTSLIMIIVLTMFIATSVNAQGEWEPQKRFTGYVSSEFNYFNRLKGYENEYGLALSEAGLLTSYQPRKDIIFKVVFVYRPDFSIEQMINEANVQYSITDRLNLKVGRFLTPLSPVNTYYYAPVNTSATLPVLVSNHEFFPLNMDALSINGSLGNDFKLSYELFAGGYDNTTWMTTGAVGFFGDEVAYYKQQIGSPYTIDGSYSGTRNLALGGNVRFAYQDYIKIGMNVFNPKTETMPIYVHAYDAVRNFKSQKLSYGLDVKITLNTTQLRGEIWNADVKIDTDDVDLKGSFIELSQTIGKLSPFVRYEDQTTNDIDFQRYTVGIAYKPTFETTFKLEYLHYNHELQNIDGLVVSLIYSF